MTFRAVCLFVGFDDNFGELMLNVFAKCNNVFNVCSIYFRCVCSRSIFALYWTVWISFATQMCTVCWITVMCDPFISAMVLAFSNGCCLFLSSCAHCLSQWCCCCRYSATMCHKVGKYCYKCFGWWLCAVAIAIAVSIAVVPVYSVSYRWSMVQCMRACVWIAP